MRDAALLDLDADVGRAWDALPPGSMLVLVTGVGNAPKGEDAAGAKVEARAGAGAVGEVDGRSRGGALVWRRSAPGGGCCSRRSRTTSSCT